MNMAKQLAWLGVVALHSVAVLAGEAQRIECPETIAASESMPSVASPWHVVPDLGKGEKRLDNVAIYSGHPRDMASLVPDTSSRKGRREKSTWIFSRDAGEPYWLACTYSNSTLMLALPLPTDTTHCDLTARLMRNGQRLAIERVSCE